MSVRAASRNTYGPSEATLGIATDFDRNYIGFISGGEVFFSLKVNGCSNIWINKSKDVFCDNRLIGVASRFESTSDDDGRHRAKLKINPEVNTIISGSCADRSSPLSFTVLRER